MTDKGSRGERVLTRREGQLLTVTLNHPAKLNVLDSDGWADLRDVFLDAARDESLRCILVEGAGPRAFSAGSDIGAFPEQRNTHPQVLAYGELIHDALLALRDCPHPTVAAIQGLCVGGGLEIAVCCDLRVCGESSRFGAPINRLGLTMAFEELEPLVSLLGPAVTMELLLTGELVDATRAREVGLVTQVCPDGEVLERSRALADRIAAGAPLVNRWHKRFIRRLGDPTPLSEAELLEAYESFQTQDYQEGVQAFEEKRTPRFEGR